MGRGAAFVITGLIQLEPGHLQYWQSSAYFQCLWFGGNSEPCFLLVGGQTMQLLQQPGSVPLLIETVPHLTMVCNLGWRDMLKNPELKDNAVVTFVAPHLQRRLVIHYVGMAPAVYFAMLQNFVEKKQSPLADLRHTVTKTSPWSGI